MANRAYLLRSNRSAVLSQGYAVRPGRRPSRYCDHHSNYSQGIQLVSVVEHCLNKT